MSYSALRIGIQFISNQILKMFSFLQWKYSMGVYLCKINKEPISIPVALFIDGGISVICYFKTNASIFPDDRRLLRSSNISYWHKYPGNIFYLLIVWRDDHIYLLQRRWSFFVGLFVFVLFFVHWGVDREIITAKSVCTNKHTNKQILKRSNFIAIEILSPYAGQ